MDLLYSRYASPMEFMNTYINTGRFGEFVTNIIKMENKRKREEADKDNDGKLWQLYVHSMPDMSFNEWKSSVLNVPNNTQKVRADSAEMTNEQVSETLEQSKNMLKNFKMNKKGGE